MDVSKQKDVNQSQQSLVRRTKKKVRALLRTTPAENNQLSPQDISPRICAKDDQLQVKPVVSRDNDASALWKAAVDRYQVNTNLEIQSLGSACSLDEVLSEISKEESKFSTHRHDGSRVESFRSLVKRTLVPIERLSEMGNMATSTAYPPAAAIFGAARYFISVANEVSADYDIVQECFEDIILYLRQLKFLDSNVNAAGELKEAILDVLTSILGLLEMCAKYTEMKRLKKSCRTLVLGEDTELKRAYEYFQKMVEREQNMIQNTILANTKETIAHFKNREDVREREAILQWLSPLDFHEKQRTTYAKYHEGTAQWLLQDDVFQNWHAGKENLTLWCAGDAGAGKTIATSMAVKYVREQSQGLNVAVVYMYCDYKDQKSGVELLSSMTRQLVEHSTTLSHDVKAFYNKYKKSESYPSTYERLEFVKPILRTFDKTYIFVDALDECSEENRDEFVRLVKELEQFARFFITSRPHIQLTSDFDNLSQINITARNSDVISYLEAKIDSNKRMSYFVAQDSNLKNDIINSISEKAAGMFLLAHLQMIHLSSQPSIGKVRTSLKSLTTRLYDSYNDAIDRINNQSESDRELARKALSYIYCAKRPFLIKELQHALSIEDGDTELNTAELPSTGILLSITAGLVRINENGNTGLVHYTLQEYFDKSPEKLIQEPEVDLAATCLTYLSFKVFESVPYTDDEAYLTSLRNRQKEYCFLKYASNYLGQHMMQNQLHSRLKMLLEFLKTDRVVSFLAQVLYSSRWRRKGNVAKISEECPKQYTSLHITAFYGLQEVLAILCKEDIDVNMEDSSRRTALHEAAMGGYYDAVRQLIEKGSDIDHADDMGNTALSLAAHKGHKPVVELLLTRGVNIKIKNFFGHTALESAIRGGHTDVVKCMLEYHGHDYLSGEEKNDFLCIASKAGLGAIVEILLHIGGNIDYKNDNGTALIHAASKGREKVVATLLKCGSDINAKDEDGNTPLHKAVKFGSVTRLLLESGADIDIVNDYGETALALCAYNGHEQSLQLLLKSKADISVPDVKGLTPLHAAAKMGHERLVMLLLKNGASLNWTDNDGWTPLHAAALKHQDSVVQLLEDCARPQLMTAGKQESVTEETKAKLGSGTSLPGLHLATLHGRIESMHALLENGADVEIEDLGGHTALTTATRIDRRDMVELLLEYGADVNKCESSGWSPLHAACENISIEVAQLLVEKGADISAKVAGRNALLLAAVYHKNLSLVQYLVEKGSDVNSRDINGSTALHLIVSTLRILEKPRQEYVIDWLIDHGAEVDVTDSWGQTALASAVENFNLGHRLSTVKVLLDRGAEIHWTSQDGCTILHIAAYNGDEELVRLLLDRGASIETEAMGHFRPLDIAILNGNATVAQLLLTRGADLNADSHECTTDVGDSGECKNIRILNNYRWERTGLITHLCKRLSFVTFTGDDLEDQSKWDVVKFASVSRNNEVQQLVADNADDVTFGEGPNMISKRDKVQD